jgi:hypothetical protein
MYALPGKTEIVASRVGSFTLGFATGALTVVALRRLRECRDEIGYERLADSVQHHLQELESRIGAGEAPKSKRGRKSPK